MQNVKVRWINFTGQKQERVFTQKAADEFIKMLEGAGLKVLSREVSKSTR